MKQYSRNLISRFEYNSRNYIPRSFSIAKISSPRVFLDRMNLVQQHSQLSYGVQLFL